MTDNKNLKDGRDNSKVSSSDDYELSYLEQKMGVSRDEVKQAIAAVGNDRDKVTNYLKKNKK